MNHEQFDSFSRRNALQRGLGAITGAALVSVEASGAWAADKKLAKSAVQYVDAGKDEGKDCDDCSQFIAGRTDLPSAQKPTSAISRTTLSA